MQEGGELGVGTHGGGNEDADTLVLGFCCCGELGDVFLAVSAWGKEKLAEYDGGSAVLDALGDGVFYGGFGEFHVGIVHDGEPGFAGVEFGHGLELGIGFGAS